MKTSKKLKVSFILLALSASCSISNQSNTDPKVTSSPIPISPSPVVSVSNATVITSTPSPVPSDNVAPEIKKLNLKGKIVYVKSEKDPNSYNTLSEIHIMNADGTNDKTLTTGFYDIKPKLSRDGSKIVFSRRFPTKEHHQYDIFTIDSDASNLLNITNSEFSEENPCFSDDSKKIAYNDSEIIYAINSDGSNEKKVITYRAFESYYKERFELIPSTSMPNWYKNKIVFVTRFGGIGGYISIANADGTSMNSINDIKVIRSFNDSNPVWSPDGSKIVFGEHVSDKNIVIINSDGTDPKIFSNLENSSYPSWSPDGTKVSFERSGEIYVINEDGTNQTKISKGYMPYWSL